MGWDAATAGFLQGFLPANGRRYQRMDDDLDPPRTPARSSRKRPPAAAASLGLAGSGSAAARSPASSTAGNNSRNTKFDYSNSPTSLDLDRRSFSPGRRSGGSRHPTPPRPPPSFISSPPPRKRATTTPGKLPTDGLHDGTAASPKRAVFLHNNSNNDIELPDQQDDHTAESTTSSISSARRERREIVAGRHGQQRVLGTPDMSSSEKRRDRDRGGHVLRTASSHSTRKRNNSGGSSIIAPPPRAAISSSSSASSPSGGAAVVPTEDHPPPPPTANDSPSTGTNTSTPPSSQQTITTKDAHLLRDRDDRIRHLEKELSLMEREFTRELDRLSQTESETATFWQSKHATTHQQLLRAEAEMRLLRNEVEVRQAEREGWDNLVRERDDEVRALKMQVRGLKEWVSTSTRTDGEARTSDEVFGEGMARLGNGLQNWVIVNFRRAKLDLEKASEDALEELGELVPMYADLASTAKVHLLQSIVSKILVDMVFNAYYFGLSEEQTSQFRKMEELLSSFADSSEPINNWRSTTLTVLRRDSAQKIQPGTDAATDAVTGRINRVLGAVTTTTTTTSNNAGPESRDQALRTLVASAVDLARLLAVQRAAFRVWMPDIVPHQRTVFDAATMEDIGGEDEDALAAREICCVAFPGIIKRGDESGGQLQYRNVIAKARVLCSPE